MLKFCKYSKIIAVILLITSATGIAATKVKPHKNIAVTNKSSYITSNKQSKTTRPHSQQNIANDIDSEVTKELSIINVSSNPTPPSTPKVLSSDKHSKRNITIIIDPGHGGKDPGAVGINNTLEKHVVLAIAKYLQQNLNQQENIKAILTRNGDYFIPLRQRLKIARRHNGNLFISIHADAYMNPYAKGAAIYALSLHGATSEAARFLAKKENESELGGIIANKNQILQSVLVNLIQTASISTSLDIGYEIIHQLDNITKLHHNVIEQAAFVVLKEPEIPSLLVETGFLSNTEEESKLRTPEYQQEIAAALFSGINNYLSKHPNFNH